MTPPITTHAISYREDPPKIRIRDLYKSFGTKRVLNGISLDIPAGTSFVVIGRSGSGKSVLLRCLLGLIPPDSGLIEFDGENILSLSRQRKKDMHRRLNHRIGMLFQNAALFDSLTVWENVTFGLLARKLIPRNKARLHAHTLLAQVGLDPSIADLYPAALSGGMQKRVGLARAIAAQPDILFFDEPTTGLDPLTGAVIDRLIVDCVKKNGSTALAITHDMASAQRIGNEAAMLYQGRIIWQGPAQSLMTSGNAYVDQFTHGRREGPIPVEDDQPQA